MEKKDEPEIREIAVSGGLTIYEVKSLHKLFLEGIQQAGGLRVDLKEVDACDAAGIQLLISLIKTAKKEGKSLSFPGLSEPVATAMKQGGFEIEKMIPRE